jgi:hypothetical protein
MNAITKIEASQDRPMPVELLRDGRGIYGIGVSDLFDYEAVVGHDACGVEQRLWRPPDLILRPDWFVDTKPSDAALQKIFGGFAHGPFCRTSEERLRQVIHHMALNRSGLPCLSPPDFEVTWWANDKKQQARNRGIYHGLRVFSLHVINRLIGKLLEEAADADAVKAARRFTFKYREPIYRAAAVSRRALQLTETFPVLAMAIYSQLWFLGWHAGADWYQKVRPDLVERRTLAAHLVDHGARLRDVAAVMNIPMMLRHIKPGVAHLASEVFCQHPELLNSMPDTTPAQRIWLGEVHWAARVNSDFGVWTAKHVSEIPGRRDQEVGAVLSDLADWACAEGPSQQFITRPFSPSMSLKTVTMLSAQWHEAVASHMTGPDLALPPPWYPAAKVGDLEIVPIEDSGELYREGAAMHHCVGTYADDVRAGWLYVYSVRRDGERVATLALARDRTGTKAQLYQLRGPCNAEPSQAIASAVQRWLRALGPLPVVERTPERPPDVDELIAEQV